MATACCGRQCGRPLIRQSVSQRRLGYATDAHKRNLTVIHMAMATQQDKYQTEILVPSVCGQAIIRLCVTILAKTSPLNLIKTGLSQDYSSLGLVGFATRSTSGIQRGKKPLCARMPTPASSPGTGGPTRVQMVDLATSYSVSFCGGKGKCGSAKPQDGNRSFINDNSTPPIYL